MCVVCMHIRDRWMYVCMNIRDGMDVCVHICMNIRDGYVYVCGMHDCKGWRVYVCMCNEYIKDGWVYVCGVPEYRG